MFTTLKWKDLYNYIQEAEVDYVGHHFPSKDDSVLLHIYNTKRQVNINVCDKPVLNIIFDPDTNRVLLANVDDNLVADYNHMFETDLDSPIDGGHQPWEDFAHHNVKELLRDMLAPYVVEISKIKLESLKVLEARFEDTISAISSLRDRLVGHLSFRDMGSLFGTSPEREKALDDIVAGFSTNINTMKQLVDSMEEITGENCKSGREAIDTAVKMMEVAKGESQRGKEFLRMYGIEV